MKIAYLLPPSAANWVSHIDSLYYALVALSVVLTLGIFTAILILTIKYRRTPDRQTGSMVIENKTLEIVWSIIPGVVGLGIFAWGAAIYLKTRVAPESSLEISVVAKQWMWKVQHPEGRREINTLHVPVNRPVVLRMISQDVIHSFYVPAFRIKQDVLPQRYTTMWFQADKIGSYHLFCTEYCGKDHSEMIGRVHVMSQEAYDLWLNQDPVQAQGGVMTAGTSLPSFSAIPSVPSSQSAGEPAAGSGVGEKTSDAGKELFAKLACIGCHGVDGGVGPKLNGSYGKNVELVNGKTVKRDENYLRESVLNPGAKIVKGYNNLMPSFAGRVSEEEILNLIAYIKTLEALP